MENKIVFQEERNTSKILKDSFNFFKLNFKDLMKKNLLIILPYFLVMLVAQLLYSYYMENFLLSNLGFGKFLSTYIFQIIAIIVFTSFVQAAILNYIKDYINNTDYNKKDFVSNVYGSFFPLIKLNGVTMFYVLLGTIFFIFPGIYLYIALLLSPVILFFKDKNISQSISESFKIIKNNWWNIFSIFLLLALVLMVFSIAYTMFFYLYNIFKTLFYNEATSLLVNSKFKDPVLLIIYIFSFTVYSILYIYVVIVYVMAYFNLIEKKNHTQLFNQIDQIGESIQ